MSVMHLFSEPMAEAEWNKVAIGTSGLLLGLIVFLAGLIIYMRSMINGNKRA